MAIQVRQLSQRRHNEWVLRDVDLTAPDGEITGILSVADTSRAALVRSLAGRAKTYQGTVERPQNGVSLVTVAAPGRKGFFRGLFGSGEPDSLNANAVVEGFHAALKTGNKTVVLDGTFDVLDRDQRQQCFDRLRYHVTEHQCAAVLVTADFGQIAQIADTVVVLAGGEIVQTGTPREIYDDPATIAVARLTGTANLIEARRLTSTNAELPEFQTVRGGHRLFAQKTEKKRLGPINQNVTLAIRPEQIAMTGGSSFPEDNLLRGVVKGTRFCGSTTLIDFDAAGLDLTARVFKVVGLNAGDECMLGLPPERIRVLTS
jgi:ABC-type sugar transport system ATPase subunit